MRKFILNVIIFGCFAIALGCAYHFFLMKPQKKIMTLPQKYTKVYFGNSTVECAINDALIPSTYNFARSSETLDVIYAKLQLIKEYNPHVDTVVMGFDDIILFKENLGAPLLSHLYFIERNSPEDWCMNFKEFSSERNSNSVSHVYQITRTTPIIKSYFQAASLRSLGIGGYLRLHRDKLNINIAEIEKNKSNKTKKEKLTVEDFPEICHYYLDKIVEYCKGNDIKLYFLNTPKHNYIWADTAYREIHRTYYQDIPLIDCMEVVFPDSCYGDCVHLNYRGADAFTPLLPELIKESK